MSKKGAKAGKEESAHKFEIGDTVLGRIKGYPPWPAKIIDPETEFLDKAVLRQKPKYPSFLLRYYDDANYSWSVPRELKPLTPREIEDFLSAPGKGKGALAKAYKTAQSPSEWEEAQAEANQEARERAAARAANADELESETEAADAGSKKRKRKADKKDGAKSKKSSKKANGDHSEDELADKPAKKKSKPAEDEAPGYKQCKEWRRELQKGFLSKSMPKPEEMPAFDKIFTDLEAYNDKAEYLELHKLPKVVKKIAQLADDQIPRDDEFKIKSRATAVVNKWQALFKPSEPNGTDEAKPAEQPAADELKTYGMDVDEPAPAPAPTPAPAKDVEAAAADTATLTEKPVETAPAPESKAELEKPVEADATTTALNPSGEPVAPTGESVPAQSTA